MLVDAPSSLANAFRRLVGLVRCWRVTCVSQEQKSNIIDKSISYKTLKNNPVTSVGISTSRRQAAFVHFHCNTAYNSCGTNKLTKKRQITVLLLALTYIEHPFETVALPSPLPHYTSPTQPSRF